MAVTSLAPRTPTGAPRTTSPVPPNRAIRLVRAVLTGVIGLARPLVVTGLAGLFWWAGAAADAPAAQAAAPAGAASTLDASALTASALTVPASGWQWPLRPRPEVVRGFDPPAQPWLSGHRGVDLLGHAGQPVYAAGAGTVTFAGMVAGRGVVTVSHGDLRTTYEPLHVSVGVGDQVSSSDVLGNLALIGGHCLPRACLHWGLLRGQQYLNPLSLVGAGPVRLLPLDHPPTTLGPQHAATATADAHDRVASRRWHRTPPPTPASPPRPAPTAAPSAAAPTTPARSAAARAAAGTSATAGSNQPWAAAATIGGLGAAGATAAWAVGRRRRC
jgi:murein DD-endopeptidase MepM/ murein hydrolase activator NlpD